MMVQVRPNIYLGDKDAYASLSELKEKGIKAVIIVANELPVPAEDESGVRVHKMSLVDGPNYGHVKDLACHIPKYLTQNGEIVLIQSVTGKRRGAFVCARAICELESKSIYEIFVEIQKLIPDLDLTKVYF